MPVCNILLHYIVKRLNATDSRLLPPSTAFADLYDRLMLQKPVDEFIEKCTAIWFGAKKNKKLVYRKETVRLLHDIEIRVLH